MLARYCGEDNHAAIQSDAAWQRRGDDNSVWAAATGHERDSRDDHNEFAGADQRIVLRIAIKVSTF